MYSMRMLCVGVAVAAALATSTLRGTAQEPQARGLAPAPTPAMLAASKGRDYAVLIAVDDYDHFPDLHNPVRDARALEHELKTVYKFDTTLVVNGTENEILEALKEVALKEYAPEDQVFVFYAGHGEVDDVDEGYVTGRDSMPQGKGGRSALSHAYLQRIVSRIRAKHVFLVLDSCFSGTFDPRIASAAARSVYETISTPELLARNLSLDARLWLTSGRNEMVSDGVPGQGSPFARMLLETLRSYGGDAGVVTTANIFSAAQTLRTQPAWGELPNHSPGGQFVFAVDGRAALGRRRLTPLEREGPAIAALLERYRAAYRGRDVDAIVQLYPSMAPAERDGLRESFRRDCKAFEVTFAEPEILIDAEGTSAQVKVPATYACTPVTGGRPRVAETQDVLEVRKVGDAWLISASSSALR